MDKSANRIAVFLLLSAIALLLVNHFFYFYGHFGYDDMDYARCAHNLRLGLMDWSDPFSYRFTLTGSVALAYQIFGVSDFASGLPAILLTSFCLFLIFYNFRDRPALVLIAFGLFAFCKWMIFYSDKLMPDVYLAAFVFFAWFVYYRQRKRVIDKRSAGVLAAFFSFCAFNAKGSIILAAPLFIVYFFLDWRNGKRKQFWRSFVLSTILLLLVYFAFIHLMTGNALSRFAAIEQNKYFNKCSYDSLPWSDLLERLSSGFALLIWHAKLYPSLIIALLYFVLRKRFAQSDKYFEAWSILILFLSANFMTISLSSYNPMCLDPRHYLFIVPIGVLCATEILAASPLGGNDKRILPALLICGLLLAVPVFRYVKYGTKLKYASLKSDIYDITKKYPSDTEFYGNDVYVRIANYLHGFDPAFEQRVHRIRAWNPLDDNQSQSFLVRNWYTEWHAKLSNDKMIELIKQHGIEHNKEAAYTSPEGLIKLYEIDKDRE